VAEPRGLGSILAMTVREQRRALVWWSVGLAATGALYAAYLAERLFTPNGLTATYYCDTKRIIPNRARGYDREQSGLVNTDFISMDLPFAAGSLCSTPRDLVVWNSRLVSGQVVNPASYREMTTPVRFATGRPMTYGFGLTADTIGARRRISHGGGINGFSALLTYVPADTLTVAVITNTGAGAPGTVTDAIVRAVLGLPAAPPNAPKDIVLAAEDRAPYVGTYEQMRPDGTRRRIEIGDENGALVFRVDSTRSAKLRSQGNHTFVIAPPLGGRITFDVVNGRATGFVTAGGRPLEAVRIP